MALDKPLGIVLKTPVKGGISATLSSGAKYEYAQTTDERYTTLMAVRKLRFGLERRAWD